MGNPKESRTYRREECAVFRKTAEAFGGLSNMAPGFPVRVNGVRILTVEALYQACRFPHRPEVQRKIIEQTSPMTAKMVGKPFRDDSRPDWDRVRVKIMRWVLRLKLAMHWTKFSELLLSTGDRPIVEDSRKDDFWGAIPTSSTTLVGMNVLGRLLMELREEIKQGKELRRVEPPSIPEFLLFDEAMGVIDFRNDKSMPYAPGVEHANQAVHDFSLPLFEEALTKLPIVRPSGDLPPPMVEKTRGMIEGLKPYSEYKQSGQEWLDIVPAHWRTLRLKTILRETDARSLDGSGLLLSLTRNRGLIARSDMTDKIHSARTLTGYKLYEPGEIVMNRMQAWSGMFGAGNKPGLVSPDYAVFKQLGDELASFLLTRIKAPDLVSQFALESKGIGSGFNRLYSDKFGAIAISLPPPDEQAAIVRFLDHANRKIDGFIRAKRKLIALLDEQKQAIIHRAVTRGLDPDVKLKPSGISWLGDIPAHWVARRVKQATRILRGKFSHRPRNDPSLYDGPYPFIQTGAVAQADKFITSHKQTLNKKGLAVSKLFPSGTLVMTIAANIGDVAILTFDACFPDSIVGFIPAEKLDRDYLYFVFRCMKSELLREAPVNTQGNLNVERIGTMWITLPPIDEQGQITKHIDTETLPFDTAIARTEREIALMQEYRTRLTADIVTGKLDVREAAAKLPDLSTDTMPEPIADEVLEEIETEES